MAKTNVRGGQIADGSSGVDLTVDVFGILPVANGGLGIANPTASRFLVGNGTSAVDTTKVVPTGTVVGTTDTQIITNKDLTSGTNTFPASLGGSNVVKSRAKAGTQITLSGTQTIDGVSLIAGDRVLLTGQTAPAENGVYVVAAGAWSRSTDANTAALMAGLIVVVTEGTTNGSRVYKSRFKATDTLGTTANNWYELQDLFDINNATQTLANKTLTTPLLTQSATPSTPAAGFDAVYTKSDDNPYLLGNDAVERPIRAPRPVRVSSTGSLTLSGTQTIDGVACVAGDRVIVRHQGVFAGNGQDNGIYVVAAGAWSRAGDANTTAEMVGSYWMVTEGTKYAGWVFQSTFLTGQVVGTDKQAFVATERIDVGGTFQPPWPIGQGGAGTQNGPTGQSYMDTISRTFSVWNGASRTFTKGIQDYTSTAPAFPLTGELWYDSASNLLKVYTGSVWTTVGISDAMPIGTVFAFAGTAAPAGSVVADGSSQLRTTYPDLLTATTTTLTGSGASGQPVVTTADTSALRIGMRVESATITGGSSTILSISTNVSFTLNANLSSIASAASFVVFPHGAVDSTHFNLPNMAGKVAVGKDGTTEFGTVGLTGGDKNLASHQHSTGIYQTSNEASGYGMSITSSFTNRVYVNGGATATSFAGTGTAGNLQPYNSLLYCVKATAASVNVALPVQTTAPSNPTVGVQWYDSTYGIHKMWTGAAWTNIGYGPTFKQRVDVTANSAAFSAQTVLATLPAITFDGVTEIELEFSWYNFSHTVTTDVHQCFLFDGAVAGSGTQLQVWVQQATANGGSGRMVWRGVPTAGSHTYTARAARLSGTGTMTMVAAATTPAQISVRPV